ncbi:MAG: ABC transporter permease [Deltaproteobacteria bacterium]|nr:ABC transporter permease [Deltaproteobacteria bacterium]MBW2075262.1 ABC transporter permease [Deltaproteobacteria bacterium]RLB81601.1 MAG: ABC transporter permease [Deltaproteobacteria bacterium]
MATRVFNNRTEENIPVFVVRPSRGWVAFNWRELWEYRELLYILTWRDIKVRYKQTAIGIAWAVIQPFFTMVVFSLFFGRLARIPSEGLPYPIFSYAALLPWQFFVKALTEASTSLVVNERVITKVYFPRLLVPTAVVLAGLLDFGIAFSILLVMMIFYGIVPSWAVLTIPLFVLLAVMTALGVSYWLSALDVEYRDVRYILPFLTQLWLFASPVVYPSTMVPEAWRALYALNPMAGVIEGFRWALLGSTPPDPLMILVSGVAIALLFVGGLIYFRRMERTLADQI